MTSETDAVARPEEDGTSPGRKTDLPGSGSLTRDFDVDSRDEPLIRVTELSVSFDRLSVLSGIDLTVERGSLVGLVGPNGAGKTTLLRAMGGTLAPDTGTVTVAGERINELSARRASRLVARVPQSTSLSFEFSVEQTVEMGRTPHVGRFGTLDDNDRAAIRAAMERTDVRAFADRSITDVSGGERQRVLLARALAQETPVLLLDEPTSSLDITHSVRTLEHVRALAAEGKTVVAAIHDLNLAARYCDELVLLSDGRVSDAGPPGAVLTADTLADAFGGDALVTTQPVADAPLVTPVAEAEPTGSHVHVVGTGNRAAAAVSRLGTSGFEVTVGVAPAGDVAAGRGEQLGCRTVTVPPFSRIDEDARQRAVDIASAADVVVVVGDVALGNRSVVESARLTVILQDTNTDDHSSVCSAEASGTGRSASASLRLTSTSELPDRIRELLSDGA